MGCDEACGVKREDILKRWRENERDVQIYLMLRGYIMVLM
jgi:hypothetical protein